MRMMRLHAHKIIPSAVTHKSYLCRLCSPPPQGREFDQNRFESLLHLQVYSFAVPEWTY